MNERQEKEPPYITKLNNECFQRLNRKFQDMSFLEQIEYLERYECDDWIKKGVANFNHCLKSSSALYEAFHGRESLQSIKTAKKVPAEPLQSVPVPLEQPDLCSFQRAFSQKKDDKSIDDAFADILNRLKDNIIHQNDEKIAPLFQAIDTIDSPDPIVERKKADAKRKLYLVDDEDMASVTASGNMLESQRLIYDAAVFINLITPNAAAIENCNPGAMMLLHYVQKSDHLNDEDLKAFRDFQTMLTRTMIAALKHEVLNLEYQKLYERMTAHLGHSAITQESKLAAVNETQDEYYLALDDFFKINELSKKIAKIVGLKDNIRAIELNSVAINEAYLQVKERLKKEKSDWPGLFNGMADRILNQEPSSDADCERIRGEIMKYFHFIEEQKPNNFAAYEQMKADMNFLSDYYRTYKKTSDPLSSSMSNELSSDEFLLLQTEISKAVAPVLADISTDFETKVCDIESMLPQLSGLLLENPQSQLDAIKKAFNEQALSREEKLAKLIELDNVQKNVSQQFEQVNSRLDKQIDQFMGLLVHFGSYRRSPESASSLEEKQKKLRDLKDALISHQNNSQSEIINSSLCINFDEKKLSRDELDRLDFETIEEISKNYGKDILSRKNKIDACMIKIKSSLQHIWRIGGDDSEFDDVIIRTGSGMGRNETSITDMHLASLEKYKNNLMNVDIKKQQLEQYGYLITGNRQASAWVPPADKNISATGLEKLLSDQDELILQYKTQCNTEFRALLPEDTQLSFDLILGKIKSSGNPADILNQHENQKLVATLKPYQTYYVWSRKIQENLEKTEIKNVSEHTKICRLIQLLDAEFKQLSLEKKSIVNDAFEDIAGVIDGSIAYDETIWSHHKIALEGILPETSNTLQLFKACAAVILGAALIAGAITLACLSFGAGAVLIPLVANLAAGLLTTGSLTAIAGFATASVGTTGVIVAASGMHRLFKPEEGAKPTYHETLEGIDLSQINPNRS